MSISIYDKTTQQLTKIPLESQIKGLAKRSFVNSGAQEYSATWLKDENNTVIVPDAYSLYRVVIDTTTGESNLYYWNGTSYAIMSGGGGSIPIGDVTNASATAVTDTVELTWSDPPDITVEGSTLVAWGGTLLVRKVGSAPTSRTDGTVILNNTTRNAYSSTPYVDSNLSYDTTYYYRFFPYSTTNQYTDGTTVSATPGRIIITPTPTITDSLTYDGTQQTITINNYDSSKMTKSGDTGTNAGTYTAVLTPKAGYCWEDGTYAPLNLSWTIASATVTIPSTVDGYVYDGSEHDAITSSYDPLLISVTGTHAATSAGSYTYTMALVDDDNYQWSDGTKADIVKTWRILAGTLTVPTVTSNLTYNGTAQSPTISSYDTTKISASGTSETNAGSYNVTFHIIDPDSYMWSDQTSADKLVPWSIAKAEGSATVSPASVTLNSSTLSATVTITSSTGTVSAATSQDTSVATATLSGSTVTITCATQTSDNTTVVLTIDASTNYSAATKSIPVTVSFLEGVYGSEWDGTSTSAWTRTDGAANFTDPQPYYSGKSGTPSSPFDNIMPWSGMEIVDDTAAGKLVKIPKFYYKWTRDGSKMKLQISATPQNGFLVSPAHADRGDGSGERDYVYIGRYHCASSTFKSTTGVKPAGELTRAEFRTNIHNLGSKIWQQDFAMFWTIRMLYLVEFADWNSQAKIGGGTSPSGGSTFNMGYTDSMPYHTGTTSSSISATVYGGTQYRYIEGLWDNTYDFCDGIYFDDRTIYAINNPANFSDDTGGTNVGTRANATGVITEWTDPSAVSGFEYALYAATVTSDNNFATYNCDNANYNANGIVLYCGGYYLQNQGSGIFSFFGNYSESQKSDNRSSRLMKLPGPPGWADATDAQLAELLQKHYAGEIDLHNMPGWEVGAERTVNLSAMSATGVGESHVAQTVTFVILNKGGKTLADGTTECAFIVGQKNCLANGTTIEGGYMNSSATNAGGWDSCARRTWCNDVYRAAIPSGFRALFKQHRNITSQGSSGPSSTTTSTDYFAFASEKEVFGTTTYANATAEASNTQFKYYETSANRIKKLGDSGSATRWWERSPYDSNSSTFCSVNSSGGANYYTASGTTGLAPFGCI